jgi:hypothetical protein
MTDPTYNCHACLDTGCVSVFDPRYRRRGIYQDCAVPCNCEAGERWAKPTGQRKAWRCRFWSGTMFRIDERGICAATIAEFEVWLADDQRRLLAHQEQAKASSNYEPAFDQYNAQQTELAF